MGNSETIRHLRIYNMWRGMKERCTNPNHKNFNIYQGMLCPEWHSSRVFIDWAYDNGYWEGATIDRIDSSKGYSPDNVQFLSHSDNAAKANSSRSLTSIEYKGKFYTYKELSDLSGVDYYTLHRRITVYKWPVDRAVEEKRYARKR